VTIQSHSLNSIMLFLCVKVVYSVIHNSSNRNSTDILFTYRVDDIYFGGYDVIGILFNRALSCNDKGYCTFHAKLL
jgi:hypothetical protein